jgi:hydroxyacylglutathione hydrolase
MHKKQARYTLYTVQVLLLVISSIVLFYSNVMAEIATTARPYADETPTPMPTPESYARSPRIGDAPIVDSAALRIYGFNAGASNAFLIETEAGVTLVDAGMPTSDRRILRKLDAIGHPNDLCQIFITHAHIDHFGGAAALRSRTGAPIIIHEDDAEALASGRTQLGTVRNWEWTELPLPLIERMLTITPTPPDRTVTHGEAITDCGLDATVVHTPGHTPGSSTLLVRDPATGHTYAFVGDLLSTTGGLHVQSSYAQNWGQIASSVADLRALTPHLLFPGHGNTVVTQDEFINYVLSGPAAP